MFILDFATVFLAFQHFDGRHITQSQGRKAIYLQLSLITVMSELLDKHICIEKAYLADTGTGLEKT